MNTLVLTAALAVASAGLAACTSNGMSSRAPESESALLQRIAEEHRHRYEIYGDEKARLERETEKQRVLEFDGRGSIIVHHVRLLGGPDRPYVRARFTYVNTSGRSLPIPTISLSFVGATGKVLHRGEKRLSRPFDDVIGNDMAHTTWIDLDISDSYMIHGWDWMMEVEFGE